MTWAERAKRFRESRAEGQSPAKREEVRKVLEKADDWTAHCHKCGAELMGTLKQLREHVCGS